MLRYLIPLFSLLSISIYAQPELELDLLVEGLQQPADITNAGDERLFIVERPGYIRILDGSGSLLPAPFLNIDGRVSPANGERGLLGLAFHPDYAQNGYFYVNYTRNNGDTRISRFSVSANDPNAADPNSELVSSISRSPTATTMPATCTLARTATFTSLWATAAAAATRRT